MQSISSRVMSVLGAGSFALFVAASLLPVMFSPVAVSAQTSTSCEINANANIIYAGSDVTLTWSTEGFSSVTINGESVALDGERTYTNVQVDTTFTLHAETADGNINCVTSVSIVCLPIVIPTCTMTPATATITRGESVTLSWTTTEALNVTLTGFGTVNNSGSQNTGPLTADATYELSVLGYGGDRVTCTTVIDVVDTPPPVLPTCDSFTATPATILRGATSTLTWTTTNATRVVINNGVGEVSLDGTYSVSPLSTIEYTLTAFGADAAETSCRTTVVVSLPIPPPTCTLTPESRTINSGESVTLVWTTDNAASVTLTSFGAVSLDGSQPTGPLTTSRSYTLGVVGENGQSISCVSVITVANTPPPVLPTCDSFTATPATILRGATSTLTWTTTNATRVVINNGVGEVSLDGTYSVSPLSTIEYTLTAFGADAAETSCRTTVVVTEPTPVPACESFTATPSSLPLGGGSVTLAWSTVNAVSVNISPLVGSVGVSGTTSVAIATTTTFNLTALGQSNQSASCTVTISVGSTPAPLTCAANVSLSGNPTTIDRGDSSVLSWVTTGVDRVSFDQGITATGLSGSVTVEPQNSTTYTLTAERGTESIACPVTIRVETGGGGGGGGGGSSSPTCELTISKNKFNLGETATLRWDSSRATDLEIVDSSGKVLVTTEGKLSDDKKDWLEGSLKVKPTKDTTYTLSVSRGSKDRTCKVKVDVEDTVVITQIRDQQPLISGIMLSEVPYTGFSAGPFMTIAFYLLLMAWALYVAYVLVIRRDMIGGYKLATAHIVADAPAPEQIRPDVFVASVRTPSAPARSSHTLPDNLPVATPVIGYEQSTEAPRVTTPAAPLVTDEVVTSLENHAHAKKALLSSDAIRHLMGTATDFDSCITILNEVIAEAKTKYPSEDGWVVINEKRMRELCLTCQATPMPSSTAPFVPTVIPEGSGSLAEAIVSGNIIAAYEMIGHRPMFALADAASDLDSVYRARRGAKVGPISDMLIKQTESLSDEKIMAMIQALTGALDGVYTDEASAVKVAIMKAVKVAA